MPNASFLDPAVPTGVTGSRRTATPVCELLHAGLNLRMALMIRRSAVPVCHFYNPKETIMTKFVLALALTFASLAAVPASAGPYCQEDLGYGRTSSFGCGG
jgi:hypothetical protein